MCCPGVGAFVGLLHLAAGHLALRHLFRRSLAVGDTPVVALARQAADALGVPLPALRFHGAL